MASSSEISWQTAWWSISPLAINTMVQPSGWICGFDPSLRTYLRSSPIVCAFDAFTIPVRFLIYRFYSRDSTIVAVRKVVRARRGGVGGGNEEEDIELERLQHSEEGAQFDEDINDEADLGLRGNQQRLEERALRDGDRNDEVDIEFIGDQPLEEGARRDGDRNEEANRELLGLQALEEKPTVRVILFIIGTLPGAIKLMAYSGILWTRLWGAFYTVEFFVVEVFRIVDKAAEDRDVPLPQPDDQLEELIRWFEVSCGGVAVLLQLALLAWVDLAIIPPDPIAVRKWMYRLLRFAAHFVILFIHFPLILIHSQAAAPSAMRNRYWGSLLISMVLLFLLLLGVQRYTQLYFVCSIIISLFAWLLYFFEVTRRCVLMCHDYGNDLQNVLAFDFFCRIFCFSTFWYWAHYNPAGTSVPAWTDFFG
jgi:hypothetical protein